jgi:predicted nucleic acid-binding protein
MRLYLEPSVLVKLFKKEADSNLMAEIISKMDSNATWSAYTSSWSFLEVARALKKDGKPRELIELDLKEIRNHKVLFKPITQQIMHEAEKIVVEHNVYASDAVHAATYQNIQKSKQLDGFLTDDRHFARLGGLVKPQTIREISI